MVSLDVRFFLWSAVALNQHDALKETRTKRGCGLAHNTGGSRRAIQAQTWKRRGEMFTDLSRKLNNCLHSNLLQKKKPSWYFLSTLLWGKVEVGHMCLPLYCCSHNVPRWSLSCRIAAFNEKVGAIENRYNPYSYFSWLCYVWQWGGSVWFLQTW